jgi:hypothetical protein
MHKSFSGSLLSRVIGDHRFNELTDFREIRRDRSEAEAGKHLIFAHGLTNWRVANTKKQPLRSVASRSMSSNRNRIFVRILSATAEARTVLSKMEALRSSPCRRLPRHDPAYLARSRPTPAARARLYVGQSLDRSSLNILVQLRKRLAQAVELIHQMKDDIDAFVVDSEIVFQILDETRPRNVHVGEGRSGGSLLWDEPALLQPELERLHLQARTSQELLLVHDHGVLSSRGSNALPFSQFETNASSSGSGDLGKTTFSLTN